MFSLRKRSTANTASIPRRGGCSSYFFVVNSSLDFRQSIRPMIFFDVHIASLESCKFRVAYVAFPLKIYKKKIIIISFRCTTTDRAALQIYKQRGSDRRGEKNIYLLCSVVLLCYIVTIVLSLLLLGFCQSIRSVIFFSMCA